MTDPVQSLQDRCEETAFEKGLAAALALVLQDVDVAAAAPGPVVAVPEGWPVVVDSTVDHPLAARHGLTFVRPRKDRQASEDACTTAAPRLARARVGLLAKLLEQAVAHLSARTSTGEPLVHKQLITGSIADVATELTTLRCRADGLARRPRTASAADLHVRIDRLDWQVSMLFGASGYITDHPVTALHLSDLVANTWLDTSRRGSLIWN